VFYPDENGVYIGAPPGLAQIKIRETRNFGWLEMSLNKSLGMCADPERLSCFKVKDTQSMLAPNCTHLEKSTIDDVRWCSPQCWFRRIYIMDDVMLKNMKQWLRAGYLFSIS
jgi:uncharacterized cysteine cluster protein YcgN (CxxCxxCC family)